MTRQEVWVRAWCVVAEDFNVDDTNVAVRWADACLESFDERFPEKTTKEISQEMLSKMDEYDADYEIGCAPKTCSTCGKNSDCPHVREICIKNEHDCWERKR